MDDLYRTCESDEKYCGYRFLADESKILRDCSDRDWLWRAWNKKEGCVICKQPGGCKDHYVKNDTSYVLYPGEYSRNEVQCYCQENNCNRHCDVTNCVTEKLKGTELEYCAKGCSASSLRSTMAGTEMTNGNRSNVNEVTTPSGCHQKVGISFLILAIYFLLILS